MSEKIQRSTIICIAVLVLFVTSPIIRPGNIWRDFTAFYCAGTTVKTQHNPYLAEPLGQCERQDRGKFVQKIPENLTLPAPLPPYDFLIFSLLSYLPYAAGGVVWSLLMVASSIITARELSKLSGISKIACFAIIVPTNVYSSVLLGEIAPLAVMAITLSTAAIKEKKPALAGVYSCLAVIQPHVGLAAVLSLLMNSSKSRIPIIVVCGLLSVISIFEVGEKTSIQYFEDVLPLHAIAESTSNNQISLTGLLYSLHVNKDVALMAGTFSLFITILTGLTITRRIALRHNDDPLMVALPVAFGIVGGIFMHVTQLPSAVPALLLIWSRSSRVWKNVFAVIVILISIPWVQFESLGIGFIIITAASISLYADELFDIDKYKALIVAIPFTLFLLTIDSILLSRGPGTLQTSLPAIKTGDFPETNWALNVSRLSTINTDLYSYTRFLSWIGTFSMVFAIIIRLRKKQIKNK